jgi:hypothetical protein
MFLVPCCFRELRKELRQHSSASGAHIVSKMAGCRRRTRYRCRAQIIRRSHRRLPHANWSVLGLSLNQRHRIAPTRGAEHARQRGRDRPVARHSLIGICLFSAHSTLLEAVAQTLHSHRSDWRFSSPAICVLSWETLHQPHWQCCQWGGRII